MGDAAGQLAERFHLLRLCKLITRGLQPCLRLAPFRDVARDLGKARQVVGLIADGLDHHRRPELAAVLPHTPTFGLILSLPCSHRQGLCGDPGRLIGCGIEDGKAPPQNLLGGVALDAVCPLVPARDVPGVIQHEYRVVLHPIDEPLRGFQCAVGLREFGGPCLNPCFDLGMGFSQAVLRSPADGHVRAQNQARDGSADHEGQNEQKRVIQAGANEWPAVRQRPPDGKARQHQCRRGRIPLLIAQRRPEHRCNCEEG